MLTHLIAVVALALGCVVWFLVQRWVARECPEAVGRRCGSCGSGGCRKR